MTIHRCECLNCGRKYDYEPCGDKGYSPQLCGPFCDGVHQGKKVAANECAKMVETYAGYLSSESLARVAKNIREKFGV